MIFDLWDTLVEWPVAEAARLRERLAALVAVAPDEFDRRWQRIYRVSQTGPLADVYRLLGVPDAHVDAHVAAHYDFGRRVLRLRPGSTAALAELRQRGLRLGVLSVCSEEVPVAWPETELAGLFDAEVFSSQSGLMKPDPESYLAICCALEVEPADCLFVGDGANDELAGAARVGMTPVLFAHDGRLPRWLEVREWTGLRVSSIEEVTELC